MIMSSTHVPTQGFGRPGEQDFRHIPKFAEPRVRTPDPWSTRQSTLWALITPALNGGKEIFETGVINAGVNGAGVKLGPAL